MNASGFFAHLAMTKQVLAFLVSLLVLLASQHCVAERAHLHTESVGRSTVAYHHHHDDHELTEHADTGSPEQDSDCGESTCFQRTSSAVTKIEIPQLDSRRVIPVALPLEGRHSIKINRVAEARPGYGTSSPEKLSPHTLLGDVSAPNAPPRSLL